MSDQPSERGPSQAATPTGDQGRFAPPPDAGPMGMYFFIVALSMFFAGGMVGYLVIRSTHQPWPPPGFPALPRSLWLSTMAIVACSVAIQRALRAVRSGDLPRMQYNLIVTLVLGVVFLALQIFAWLRIAEQLTLPSEAMGPYVKLFYFLTGLHAVHVLGGLGTLLVVTRRAIAGRYNAQFHPGVRYSAIYWHFLDAVWCVMFTVLYLI